MKARGANRGALVPAVAVALALPTVATGSTGGQPAPGADAVWPRAVALDPPLWLSARRSVFVGRTLRLRGAAEGAAGRTVRVERRERAGVWSEVAAAKAARDGSFSATWAPDRPGRYRLRAVVERRATRSAAAPAATASLSRGVTVYRPSVATWYGPGLYGNRTACGRRLTPRTLGVAHRTLPCGTRVAVSYRGRSLVVPVIDRGPFAPGIEWDLAGAVARRLGLSATRRIGVAELRRGR